MKELKKTDAEIAEEKFNADVAAKATELSKKYDCDVTPIVVDFKGEKVVGYFQEPSVDIILYSSDKFMDKKYSDAGEAILRDCILPESDLRVSSDERKHARLKASFTLIVSKLVTPYKDEYKKK